MVTTRSAERKAVEEKAAKGKAWHETDGAGDHSGLWGIGGTAGKALAYAGTVALLLLCPAVVIYLWFTLTQLDGSLAQLYGYVKAGGLEGVVATWPAATPEAWKTIAIFGALQAGLQLFMPGKRFEGPISPKGNVPVYKANGVQSFIASLMLFFAGWRLNIFDPARVYDIFGEILAALNIFSLLLCTFLYFKGKHFPSSSDNGTTGSFVYDFYWGRELYPRLGRHFDIKTWTNCRMGMMSWAILPLCYAAAQLRDTGTVANSMLVSVALAEAYVAKFFLWETGYWRTMDIAHDRAGYYLCWGCLNWVPGLYTSQQLFLASHPYQLPTATAAAILAAGLACIYVNWDADRQRQVFRATDGKALVWGRKPKVIVAKYRTGNGREAQSLLLASGYWGFSRHFHYVPEVLAAVCWTAPAGVSRPLVWFYVTFLTLLLLDRSHRDEERCQSKYGAHWAAYCKAVPYRLVKYIY